MATCRTCAYLRKCIEKATKEGYEHNVDFDPKDGCTGIGFKSNTNADRIRAMSDEELAEFICGIFDDDEYFGKFINGCIIPCYDQHKIAEWLKQPASEPPKEEAQQDCTYNKNGHCIGQKLMPECDAKNCDRRK